MTTAQHTDDHDMRQLLFCY